MKDQTHKFDKRFKEIKDRITSIREEATKANTLDLIFINGAFAGLMGWIGSEMELLEKEIVKRQISSDNLEEMNK